MAEKPLWRARNRRRYLKPAQVYASQGADASPGPLGATRHRRHRPADRHVRPPGLGDLTGPVKELIAGAVLRTRRWRVGAASVPDEAYNCDGWSGRNLHSGRRNSGVRAARDHPQSQPPGGAPAHGLCSIRRPRSHSIGSRASPRGCARHRSAWCRSSIRDRQFFKSAVGLPEPWMTRRETPLSHSFLQARRRVGDRAARGPRRQGRMRRSATTRRCRNWESWPMRASR